MAPCIWSRCPLRPHGAGKKAPLQKPARSPGFSGCTPHRLKPGLRAQAVGGSRVESLFHRIMGAESCRPMILLQMILCRLPRLCMDDACLLGQADATTFGVGSVSPRTRGSLVQLGNLGLKDSAPLKAEWNEMLSAENSQGSLTRPVRRVREHPSSLPPSPRCANRGVGAQRRRSASRSSGRRPSRSSGRR